MQEASNLLNGLKFGFLDLAAAMVNYLPNLLAALAFLIGGWLIAKLVRNIAVRLMGGLNQLLENISPTGTLSAVRISNKIVGLIGTAAFWLVFFVFITAASDAAELTVFSNWLENIVAYLPYLLGGGFLIFFGYLFSIAVRDVVTTTLSSLSVRQSTFIGAAAQW